MIHLQPLKREQALENILPIEDLMNDREVKQAMNNVYKYLVSLLAERRKQDDSDQEETHEEQTDRYLMTSG